ncbi:hypothetical protein METBISCDRAFT_26620 [Metschnikowia bicuspidata]|uniref:Mediator of RNA polymerase II transcription subunit 13 n=1 Tax=Metschnikowia bicuspidata TaxID=27322 RepID=A0A4V1J3A7_9ASCO|nr:hypothetical protein METBISCDRAFT_26620 [Metschnikowia bicuspidata]
MAHTRIADKPREALKIQTHYFKIAHINLVSFLIYGPSDDKLHLSLLEFEVEIRAQHPRILLTYYNKHLYHFSLGHWRESAASENGVGCADAGPEALDAAYPELKLKHRNSVAASKLANPVRAFRARKDAHAKDDTPDDEHLPFASLSFLKAVKKSLMYNLSLQGEMIIFGNCLVGKIVGTDYQYRVTQIDPILLANGDIIVSLTQRNSLLLFHSRILQLEKRFADFIQAFVLYVIPSGLRCHLYDTTNILASFTNTPPKGSDTLSRLLELSTGIKLLANDLPLWVKLVPNLQHLNNQTSKISKFIHNVDNKKYILWPWELCLLQFGSGKKRPPSTKPASCVDPLALISDFLQFSLTANEDMQRKPPSFSQSAGDPGSTVTPRPFLVELPSLKSTDERKNSTTKIVNSTSVERKESFEIPSLDLYPTFSEAMSDTAAEEGPAKQDEPETTFVKDEEAKDNKYSDKDLFGDTSDLEILLYPSNDEETATAHDDAPEGASQAEEIMDTNKVPVAAKKDSLKEKFQDNLPGMGANMQFDFVSSATQTPDHSTIIEIPRDQMISLAFETEAPSSYEDPGAPPPLVPTPVLPQNPTSFLAGNSNRINQHKLPKVHTATGAAPFKSPALKDDLSNENSLKYMFLPINFNPKIKNKIDTKYGKGGKFYVERDTSCGSDGDTNATERKISIHKNEDFKLGPGKTDSVSDALKSLETSHRLSLWGSDQDELRIGLKSGDSTSKDHNISDEPIGNILAEKAFEASEESAMDVPYWPNDLNRAPSEDAANDKKEDSPMEEDEEDEESDVDEEFPDAHASPLRLNFEMSDQSQPNTTIDVDEEEDDDFRSKDSGLSVKVAHIEEYLYNITSILMFDCGASSINSRMELKLPEKFNEEIIEDTTDGSVCEHTLKIISTVFPLNYRINLGELIRGDEPAASTHSSDGAEETNHQLLFSDEIVDESLLDSNSAKGPKEIYWDTLAPNQTTNRDNFQLYRKTIDERDNRDAQTALDENSTFLLNDAKVKVLKNGKDVINLDFIGIQFWKYLNILPINGPKKFQILLVTENDVELNNGRIIELCNPSFLELLKHNFRNNHLGSIKKLHLPTPESRKDLEGINNGLIVVDKQAGDMTYSDFYKKVNKRLKDVAELIKLDIINKSNRFEFDRPLLLLFISYDSSILAISQIAKICRNFQLFLNNHQLLLVDVFSHVIPSDFVVKKTATACRLKHLSDLKLVRLSMILYNKCPSPCTQGANQSTRSKYVTKSLYTHLVQEPPSALHFKVINKIGREGSSPAFYEDLFLHVAYERSVDKEWILAAWSDPSGTVTFVKSWYCHNSPNGQTQTDTNKLGTIINDIWTTSNLLFAKLNEDSLQCIFGSGKKNYLVLTRISSIIPDDELIHWKRLTTKDKEISLVVLSTNRLPKILFQARKDSNISETPGSPQSSKTEAGLGGNEKNLEKTNADFFKSFEGANSSPNCGFSLTSPLHLNIGSQSPSQFLSLLENFLSPIEMANTPGSSGSETEYVVRPPFYDILAVLPKVALPSFNSPTRLGMLIGYLIKETLKGSYEAVQKYMVFEVTLLSCSAYWNTRSLMKILLNHYKKMIVLNEIIGTSYPDSVRENSTCATYSELRSFVPWHIAAVGKTLEYLTHVHVEGGE